MFSIVLIVLLAGLLLAASARLQGKEVDPRATVLLLGSYALRLTVAPFTRTARLFSNGGGAGDALGYERIGEVIARLWHYHGIHYVGGNELPELEQTSLPANIFAGVIYLNGGPTHWGCVALVAAAASYVCLDLYLLSLELGARRGVALAIMALIAALPSFLYYTSDTYKDGFVTLFVLGIFGCSVRLAHRFSVMRLGLAIVLLGGLWLTRFYLVFVMPAPLLLGLLGLRSGSVMRVVLAVLLVVGGIAAALLYSDAPAEVTSHAMRTFQGATSQDVLNANADSGSGVTFGPNSSFLLKLAYTLFSPFPWQAGSIGLQIAKIEVLVWYYFFYRAVRASRMLWRDRRADLLMFVSFAVPMAAAYALSFSNIGLIVRERMNIVLATIVVATVSWPARRALAGTTRPVAIASAALPRGVRRLATTGRAPQEAP